jgi:hypothetical protein
MLRFVTHGLQNPLLRIHTVFAYDKSSYSSVEALCTRAGLSGKEMISGEFSLGAFIERKEVSFHQTGIQIPCTAQCTNATNTSFFHTGSDFNRIFGLKPPSPSSPPPRCFPLFSFCCELQKCLMLVLQPPVFTITIATACIVFS